MYRRTKALRYQQLREYFLDEKKYFLLFVKVAGGGVDITVP